MYVPGIFSVSNELMEAFIKENSFATIVCNSGKYPAATHIPVEIEINENGEKVLWGHLSRSNPQWRLFEKYPDVTVIYLSPLNAYISSSWYDHPNAPTWNYVSVQVTGTIEIVDEQKAWESVRRLMIKYEKHSKNPVALDTLPPHVQEEMKGLVAFEIKIDSMHGAFKLSQNRDDKNFENILTELSESDNIVSKLLAAEMKKHRG